MISDEKLNFLERFGDSDHQDMVETIRNCRSVSSKQTELIISLQFQVAELEHSQMKKENNQLRKSLLDTNKNYTDVVNENLALRRELGR